MEWGCGKRGQSLIFLDQIEKAISEIGLCMFSLYDTLQKQNKLSTEKKLTAKNTLKMLFVETL